MLACFGASGVQVCVAPPERATVFDHDHDVDTSGDMDCTSRTGPYCVIAATSITISATLRAHGARPLVLVATGTITIPGAVDVSGRDMGAPNVNAACTAGNAPAVNGGGYGGGRGTAGAAGGYGNALLTSAGGVPATPPSPDLFAGGCDGGRGAGAMAGAGGRGGGAVAVIANSSITIDGTIRASGAGGGGATKVGGGFGGGGGGSGGMIVLGAPAIAGGGTLEANGGGGGAGSEGNADGGDGKLPVAYDRGGLGGASTGKNDAGGDGAGLAAGPVAGSNAVSGAGGGGGGGGVGVIVLGGATFARASPPPI